MKKKFIGMAAAFALVFVLSSATVFADESADDNVDKAEDSKQEEVIADVQEEESRQCGEHVFWTVDSDGVMTFSGYGAIDEEPFFTMPADEELSDRITKVVIEEGITNIPAFAFYDLDNLESIMIPDSVMSIGDYAITGNENATVYGNTYSYGYYYAGWYHLAFTSTGETEPAIRDAGSWGDNIQWKLDYGGTLTISGNGEIGEDDAYPWSMYYLDVTKTLVQVEGMKKLPARIFYNFDEMKEVELPESLTEIAEKAFYNCSAMAHIGIPGSVRKIAPEAFSLCESLNEIIFPDGMTSISDNICFGCRGLTRVEIPDNVTAIGNQAFSGCTGLNKIMLPAKVKNIGESAFSECSALSDIQIPSALTMIKDSTFYNCESLNKIVIPDKVTSIGRNAFHGSGLTSIVLPPGIVSISEGTFGNCQKLKNVTIPEGVTYIGANAFYNCSSLTGITLPESVFDIEKSAFWRATGLRTIVIPKNVNRIKNNTFEGCTNLVSADCRYVSEIEAYAFNECTGLEKIHLSDRLKKIGEDAFAECFGLKQVIFYGTRAAWDSILGSTGNYRLYEAALVFKIDLGKPVLKSAVNNLTGVKITWGSVDKAEKYRIFRKVNSGKWVKLADTARTFFTDQSAESGTTYTYTVRCISKDGRTYTSEYDTKGKTITFIAAPVISSIQNAASGVQLKWGKIEGTARYRIFRKTAAGSWVKCADTDKTNYIDTKAEGGVKYIYTVRCISDDGRSYLSAYDTKGKAIVFLPRPAAPAVSSPKSGQMLIKWTNTQTADGYWIQYSTDSRFATNKTLVKIDGADRTSNRISSLESGKTYYVRIRTYKRDGSIYYSAFSAIKKVTVR